MSVTLAYDSDLVAITVSHIFSYSTTKLGVRCSAFFVVIYVILYFSLYLAREAVDAAIPLRDNSDIEATCKDIK